MSSSDKNTPAILPEPKDPDAIYVLDISSYIFRAYHALPPLSNSKGEAVHAVHGVAQMLLRLLEKNKPCQLIVALDSPGPSFRQKMFKAYKATRPPAPEDLKSQVLWVIKMVEAWGLPTLGEPGYEADDIIASLVKEGRKAGKKIVIVSADKDLLQLVGPDVIMFDTMRNMLYGIEETKTKLGVPPEKVRDYLALVGDTSDNIPGVPSVGQKTAAKLLTEYANLEEIYENIDQISGKALKEKLIANKEQAYLSRDLVTLKDDIKIDITVFDSPSKSMNNKDLREVFHRLEFHRLLSSISELAPAELEENSKNEVKDEEKEEVLSFEIIENKEVLQSYLPRIRMADLLIVETFLLKDGKDTKKFLLSLGMKSGVILIPLILHGKENKIDEEQKEILALLKPTIENSLVPKLSSDSKKEIHFWDKLNIRIRGCVFDAKLASYLLFPERHAHELKDIFYHELNKEIEGLDKISALAEKEQYHLAVRCLNYLFSLNDKLTLRLQEQGLLRLYRELELPLAQVLAHMEKVGIFLDKDLLRELNQRVTEDLKRLEKQSTDLAGHDFNVNSPRQLEIILFDELKLPVIKKTKTSRSTDHEVLEELAIEHELPGVILEHRMLAKLKSTYLEALVDQIDPSTGNVHTEFNQAMAATGRISSSNPNLQNIPIRTETGRKIREAFIPHSGLKMMAADYSQIELKVLAHLSEDKDLLETFSTGGDVHKRTASAIFDVSDEAVTRDMRAQAKTVNFAVIYGQSQFALAKNLKIGRREAKKYIDAFFERYSGVKNYMDYLIESGREKGYVETIFGRRRALPDLRSSNHRLRAAAERISRNAPIQGSAADIMKKAMILIDEEIRRKELQARMLLTVHDELVFEAPLSEKEMLEALVKDRMENAVILKVPLPAEVGWGDNWGTAH